MSRPKTLIHGAIAVSEGLAARRDILIEDGRIAAISENIQPDGTVETVNGEGCIVTYGLADVHVHLREPGFSSKETIRSGTLAAAHGGFTTVCAMPNLNPAPDSPEHLAVEQELIRSQAVIDVRPYGAITVGRSGRTISDVEHLAGEVVGFSDDGCGVQSAETMFGAMKRIAAVGGIVAAHCEDESLLHGGYIHDGAYACRHGHAGICSKSEWAQVVRDIRLAAESGCRYHACHISTAESVELVREARMEGLEVSCETAPHYLTLTEDDLQEEGRFKMNPPLRSAADRNALIKGIQDGTIEVIATDHAPHTAEEKSRGLKGSAMGIVGLLLMAIDYLPHLKSIKNEDQLTPVRALIIGILQVFALIPGTSRSGTTIIAGRLMGLDSESAAEYSFLASIPIMGAVCLRLFLSDTSRAYLIANLGTLIPANIVAFLVGLVALRFLLRYLKKPKSLQTFGRYRVIVACLVLGATLIFASL